MEYHDREDTAVYVKFPITTGDLAGKASIVIWTTTPWTLPANLAIAVHPKELYVAQEFDVGGAFAPGRSGGAEGVGAQRPLPHSETLVLAARLVKAFCAATGFEPIGEPISSFPGSQLEGGTAQHPFLARTSKILTADFVTMDTGTGCVHIAPGHGEDVHASRFNVAPTVRANLGLFVRDR